MKKPIALRLFLFVLLELVFLIIFSNLNKSNASIIVFHDDFENGKADQWTPISGQNLWQVKDFHGNKMYGALITSPGIVIDTIANNTRMNNYSFAMDMYPVSGLDKNIRFRWTPETGFCNQFHINDYTHVDRLTDVIDYTMQNEVMHHIEVTLIGARYILVIDGKQIANVKDPSSACLSGSMGLTISTGSVFPTEIWFDNIVVTSLDDTPSPTLSPTPIPTPTPTPIPDLDVHLLKQTSEPWQSQIYDAANEWAHNSPTIKSWGCALTSAAMVLSYHGINKLPNGTILDPGTLNTWLKGQKDGYIGIGWVNWLAISRLSKLAKTVNGITNFDALEYSVTYTRNADNLTNDIKNSYPDILGVPGHFVVAKGINGNTFNINDPYYSRTTLIDYGNSFYSIGTYKPSNTDLSYIMFNTDSDINIEVKNSSNNTVGENFVQEPITNPYDPDQMNSSIKIFYLPQPTDKYYKLTLSSTTNKIYNLGLYFYDQDGNVNILNQIGFINPSKTDNYTINFDKQNSTNSTNSKIVTFQTLIDDINEASKLNLVKPQMAKDLIKFAKRTQQDYGRNKRIGKLELTILQAILKAINKTPLIKDSAYRIINYDVDYLKFHL